MTSTNGASPQPDEVYLPASRRCGRAGGADLRGGLGVVCRLRSRIARGGWAVPVMNRVAR